jgi:hypothetical protein
MAQPPTTPLLAHENVRMIPALTQKTFCDLASVNQHIFIWEFDLAARITDPGQLLNANAAPTGSSTIAGGGAGPQTTPQPAIGPLADVFIFTNSSGGGTLRIRYAADANPCSYYPMYTATVPTLTPTNVSGLRVTGRFIEFFFQAAAAAACVVECGFYIRNT